MPSPVPSQIILCLMLLMLGSTSCDPTPTLASGVPLVPSLDDDKEVARISAPTPSTVDALVRAQCADHDFVVQALPVSLAPRQPDQPVELSWVMVYPCQPEVYIHQINFSVTVVPEENSQQELFSAKGQPYLYRPFICDKSVFFKGIVIPGDGTQSVAGVEESPVVNGEVMQVKRSLEDRTREATIVVSYDSDDPAEGYRLSPEGEVFALCMGEISLAQGVPRGHFTVAMAQIEASARSGGKKSQLIGPEQVRYTEIQKAMTDLIIRYEDED